ncbi:hypothetical protein HYDPIDRAFT_29528 [Hydnomerulius pinastri MD-312]|uniref:Unplaced genomic scaffold scaffold_17, whole genome shotgun sequence n=1 Tax=Hydnomerulius pinastri MD-312 TaxID=994086 RepID=A0A0C9WDQ6_9AGAM|nr:hypothetical protein HYDPIDRAFT_29528 [Hydnomerulius pinastri MD-312]
MLHRWRHKTASIPLSRRAAECEAWHQGIIVARKCELMDARAALQKGLSASIFILARLKGIGYGAEIDHFGLDERVTDREWECVSPKLEETMKDFRMMETQLYNPRQRLLVELYNDYVHKPAPEGGAIDLPPSVVDLAKCAAFDTVIKLPEVNVVETNAFEPAFEQLPMSVVQWRGNVERQLASLIVVPINPTAAGVPVVGLQTQEQKPVDRLKLAVAVLHGFHAGCLWKSACILAFSL